MAVPDRVNPVGFSLLRLLMATLAITAGRPVKAADISVVPQPAVVTSGEGTFTFSGTTRIVAPAEVTGEATLLAESLRPATGLPLDVSREGGPTGNVELRTTVSKALPARGSYVMDVKPDGVTISADDSAGLFYGAQTLRQLLPAAAFSPTPVSGVTWSVPCVHIEDHPRFPWRGMMLDCSRHFFPVEFVERFIDLLAVHKMNTFHWHLTDDQGWRIEIKKYPRLTGVGSVRSETLVGHAGGKNPTYDGKPYGGFYKQDQVRAVVAYAAARHVTVVPEIEMPGHSAAAIAAYPFLGCTDGPVHVRTTWGVEAHILNPSARTVQFYQDVLTEVMGLFPSPYIHVGGDEAPKDEWNHSPAVQAQIKSLGLKDADALQSWFIGQMDGFLSAHGRHLIGWDEILEGGLTPGAAVMSWHGDSAAAVAAREGHGAVNASNKATYLDHYQSKGRAHEPLAIGAYLPLEVVYAFDPMPAGLSAGQQRCVLGGQGQVWTEYIPTPRQAEYMAYPRGCALAETDWTAPGRKDYAGFVGRLRVHLDRLAAMGVNYRKPDPETR